MFGLSRFFKRRKKSKVDVGMTHTPSVWTRAQAKLVKADHVPTTQPAISDDFPIASDVWYIWDTWPLMDEANQPVKYNGWNVIFSLIAPRDRNTPNITEDFNNRHDKARIGVWISRDAKSWQFAGKLFEGVKSLGDQEWAGCCVLNKDNEISVYYTAKYADDSVPTKVTGEIHSDSHGVWFTGFRDFIELFKADGTWYQTFKQNPYFGFRDPWFFRDPKDGQAYLLFEGNVGGDRGSHAITDVEKGKGNEHEAVPAGANYQTANIGIARATDPDCDTFELLPPLLTAVGVNDQTERPHMVFQDGKVYLFTISHTFTYAAGLTGPDGVYGFVADSIFGPYKPLNKSGLVLGNPSSGPYQSYSHYVMPNKMVEAFIDSVSWRTGEHPKGDYRVGGTWSPSVQIEIKGDTTEVQDVFDYGYIPSMVSRVYRKDKVER